MNERDLRNQIAEVKAGRLSRLAGRIAKKRHAEASSPQFGLVGP